MEKREKKQVQMKRRAIWAVVILAAVGTFLLWRGKSYFFVPYILCVYFLSGIFVYPLILRPADLVARGFTYGSIWLITRVVLTFVYFLVITPIALWFKLRRRDRLELKFPGEAKSFWHHRSPDEQIPTCRKQY